MKKFKISTCSNYNNKADKLYNNDKVSKGWEQEEFVWSKDEVVIVATTLGISMGKYKDGSKNNESWEETTAIMLDFDTPVNNKEDIIALIDGHTYDAYIYSSQNHQKPKNGIVCDRIRVLIPLATPITDETTRKAVEMALIGQFPGIDESFMDKARYFAHGTTEVSHFIGNKEFFDWEKLDISKELSQIHEIEATVMSSSPENNLIYLNTKVELANSKIEYVEDIPPKTSIFCPFCGHDKTKRGGTGHNAVLMLNVNGEPFISCSSCKGRGDGNKGVYNFNEVDKIAYMNKQNNILLYRDIREDAVYGGTLLNTVSGQEFVTGKLKTKDSITQFCRRAGIQVPYVLPSAITELNFGSDKHYQFAENYVNSYRSSEYLKKKVPYNHKAKMPKYIGKLLSHVMGYDADIEKMFLNDYAHLIQNRQKLITAHLWQGAEGTGKGFLYNRVLRPIIGGLYAGQGTMDIFAKEFNEHLETNVLFLVNEASMSFVGKDSQMAVVERIKTAISDVDNVRVEGKGLTAHIGKNVCSFIFSSNRNNAVVLSPTDRRFNVAPRQETPLNKSKWWLGDAKMERIIDSEIQEFVWYMQQYPIDKTMISKTVDNIPKRALQERSLTNSEKFFKAVNDGDRLWLLDNANDATEEFAPRNGQGVYRATSVKFIIEGLEGQDFVNFDDLREIYNNISATRDLTVQQFSNHAAAEGGLELKRLQIGGKRARRYMINWRN